MRAGLLLASCGAVLAALGPAPARAMTMGPTKFVPAAFLSVACDPACTLNTHTAPAGVGLSAPSDGIVTRFRIIGSGPFTLRVMRYESGISPARYQFKSTGPTVTASSLQTLDSFAVRFPVSMFDSIGVNVPPGSSLVYSGTTPGDGWAVRAWGPVPADGASVNSTSSLDGAYENYNWDWEPDADGDGFGDDSQDRCTGSAGSDRGCAPGVLDPQVVQVVQTVTPVGGLAQLGGVSLNKGRSKLSVAVSCPSGRSTRCRGATAAETADKVALPAGAAKKRVLKLGRAKFDIAAGTGRTFVIRLSSKSRRAIRPLRRLRLKLTLTESASSRKTF